MIEVTSEVQLPDRTDPSVFHCNSATASLQRLHRATFLDKPFKGIEFSEELKIFQRLTTPKLPLPSSSAISSSSYRIFQTGSAKLFEEECFDVVGSSPVLSGVN